MESGANFRGERWRRWRLPIVALAPALVAATASVFIASGVARSLQGFTASVTNGANSYSSGTLLLSETQGANTCISTGSDTTSSDTVNSSDSNTGCTAINLFGSQSEADPGVGATTSAVTVKNIGTIDAGSLTLTPGGCTATANSATSPYSGSDTAGFCGDIDLTISDGTNCLYPSQAGACPAPSSSYTVASLGTSPFSLGSLAAGATATYTFTLQLDSSADSNADQGLSAAESFAWNLTQ